MRTGAATTRLEITGVAGMEQAGPSELTFLANPKYAHKVKHTRAGAVLVAAPVDGLAAAQLISTNPYLDFARALAMFYQPPRPAPGIHPPACVADFGAHRRERLHRTVRGGRRKRVHRAERRAASARGDLRRRAASATISCALARRGARDCRIGNRVTLQNGVVIGGDGFGFAKRADGTHYKIVQSGVTVIEDDVEIQTLTSVDRATMGETRVKRGAKIDSLVQIGHACVVGEDNIICAQTGLAGSSILEKNVLLAGQVGVSGHLTIHDNAVIYAQSGIGGDVAGGRGDERIARVRSARMAARHHRVSETAGDFEDNATIGETARRRWRQAAGETMSKSPRMNPNE